MSQKLDLPYWLALVTKGSLRSQVIERVFLSYNSIEPLWTEKPETFRQMHITESEITKIIELRKIDLDYFIKLNALLKESGIKVIRYVDSAYPSILKDFGNYHIRPPLALLIKGYVDHIRDGVAIVGTRECSFHGHTMARTLARTIAKAGYIIYSGLARGIDTEAHCGALEAKNGKTVAVLPWLSEEDFYPDENIQLAADIARNGAVLSEYYDPPRAHPTAPNARAAFVIRNRITSGLARCIILVESGSTEGTYRQATIAKDQGRKMFAVKPKSDNKVAVEGFKQFISMGATPIESAKPVLQYLKEFSAESGKEKTIDHFTSNSLSNSFAVRRPA
jgi:DNA processing protein